MLKKIFSLIIVFMLTTLPIITFATSGDLNEKKNEIEDNIDKAKEQQKDIKEDISQTQSEINKLNERDKQIMVLRYGLNNTEEYTQKEVAEMLGISQSYISRIEKKVIKNLKTLLKI